MHALEGEEGIGVLGGADNGGLTTLKGKVLIDLLRKPLHVDFTSIKQMSLSPVVIRFLGTKFLAYQEGKAGTIINS